MEHINKAILSYSNPGSWQDFANILIANGYEVTAKIIEEYLDEYSYIKKIEISWGDKA